MTTFQHLCILQPERVFTQSGGVITAADGLPLPGQTALDASYSACLAKWQEMQTIPVPDSITPLQRNLWLGPDRYNQALAFINALPDAAQRFEAMRHWLNASTTRRDNPWTITIAKQCLGMTDEEIDQAFREAAAL